MRLLGFGAVGVLLLGGCGLTLDYDPPDDGGSRFDAQVRADAASSDAGERDGGPPAECTTDSDCGNGDVCDGNELCLAGRCADGAPLDCEDAFDCTVDVCDPAQGCQRTPDDTRCEDDGVGCTIEQCVVGSGCVSQPDHTECADAVRCTRDVCDTEEGCLHHPMNELCAAGHACDVTGDCDGLACEVDSDCADVPLGPCELAFTCVAARCVPTLRAAGDDCSDGNPCTTAACTPDGACRGVERTDCDGQPCWRCNPAGGGCDGSLLKPAGATCEDGNLCTSGDTCADDGSCGSSAVRACASPPCRTGSCNPASGECAFTPVAAGGRCDDGDPCTAMSSCDDAGNCSVHTPFCAPGPDPCTTFSCRVFGGTPTCDRFTLLCGSNSVCAAGECLCAPGFQDCNGDGDCECNNAEGFCAELSSGSRTCTPYMECRGGCTIGQRCCACTGMCCSVTNVSCCAGCPAVSVIPGG